MTVYLDASNSSKNCWFDTWIVSHFSTEILTQLWLEFLFLRPWHSLGVFFKTSEIVVNLRGRPFDFWWEGGGGGGRGGVWVISEGNILQTDFKGKKYIAKKYLRKKYIALKKRQYMLGEKVQRFGKKKSYANQITYSPSKVKWSTSNAIFARMLVFLQFF